MQLIHIPIRYGEPNEDWRRYQPDHYAVEEEEEEKEKEEDVERELRITDNFMQPHLDHTSEAKWEAGGRLSLPYKMKITKLVIEADPSLAAQIKVGAL